MKHQLASIGSWTVKLVLVMVAVLGFSIPQAHASPYCSTFGLSCGEVTNNSSYPIYVGPFQGSPGYPAAYYTLYSGQKSTVYLTDTDFVAPISKPIYLTWGVTTLWVYPGQYAEINDYVHLTCVNGSSGNDIWCHA